MNREPRSASGAELDVALFDVYGTLLDVFSVGALAEEHFPGKGAALASLWRERQVEYTRICSMGQRYRPFWELTRAALRQAAAVTGCPLSTAVEDALMAQYLNLTPFQDARATLEKLHAQGVRCGVLSNGNPEMLTACLGSAGLLDLLDPVLSVDAVARYKTDPAVYALGPAALGQPAERILFVSSNGWDAIGATWAGYPAMWINRTGLPLEQLDTEPAYRGTCLNDVIGVLRG